MIIQANRQTITAESKMYFTLSFQLTDEDLSGLSIFFVISDAEGSTTPTLSKNEADMIIATDTVSIPFTTADSAFTGTHWFELWIEWLPEQWSKEFEGEFTLTPSINYQQIP